jgi:hypothetical protein
MDREITAFNDAMGLLKLSMFNLGLRSTRLMRDDPESLRAFAIHARKMAKAFDALMETGSDLVSSDVSWGEAVEAHAFDEFAPALDRAAAALEDDEDERYQQDRWAHKHKQLVDPARD